MSVKVKRAASSRRKRLSPRRLEPGKKPSIRYRWLTMLSDEGEASENEELGEEDEKLNEELSSGISQPLRIRRE
jgi:hypothetical protein